MTLERLWAGWRGDYVSGVAESPADAGSDDETAGEGAACVLCRIVAAEDAVAALVLERTATTFTVMNLYPYASGHLMVAPLRHEPDLDGLADDEAAEMTSATRRALRAVRSAYGPDGVNVGGEPGARCRRRGPRAPARARRPPVVR
ncbi:MAG: hypothetical protein M5T61_11155 [Acidimicrobiia bacterium]|nr:hypothetical protein [Acidimicrobiia bacterium]